MSSYARVAIVQRSLRRYRERFYEQLRTELRDRDIHLRLVHNTDPAREQRGDPGAIPWAEVAPARYWDVRGDELVWQPCLRLAREVDLVIVEQAAVLLANYFLLAGQRLGGPRVAFWGHGVNFNLNARSSVGEAVKRLTSRQAHWWFPYTDEGADIVHAIGFPRERMTIVRNATDTKSLAAQVDSVTDAELAELRVNLGLTGTNVGVFVGALGRYKGLDYLIAAADRIRATVADFELVVAGGGPSRDLVTQASEQRPWMKVIGPQFAADLAALLKTAKVLLLPGAVGLVVVDSFAAGVPLVASASLPHGPEIRYLQDGSNGRLVDDGGDPERYAAAVVELLVDEVRRGHLVSGCLAARQSYSVEDMASRFASGIERALEYPPVRDNRQRENVTPAGNR